MIATEQTPEKTWKTTLGELELQMTKATYNSWLKDARLVEVQDDCYVIAVRTESALDWVENRLRDTILRALSSVAGRPVQLRFLVAGQETTQVTPGPAQNGVITSQPPNGAAVESGRAFDFSPLPPEPEWESNSSNDIQHGHPNSNLPEEGREAMLAHINEPIRENGTMSENGSGGRERGGRKKENPDDQPITFRNTRKPRGPLTWHVQTSHYAIRFWLPLLGMEAFTLLVVISSYHYEVEHLNRPAPSLTKLASKMGYSDTLALKGRKAYGVSDPRAARPGLLDRLRDHQLCLHRTEGYGKGIRHFFDYLTKVEDLPLLTPRQVARLSEADKEEHTTWLKLHKVNLEAWAADERETDIDLIPDDALDLSMSRT